MTLSELRHKHPVFYYHHYSNRVTDRGLEIEFLFSFDQNLVFRPTMIIPGVNQEVVSRSGQVLDDYIFHIGLVEMLSYWKAACSPEIVIEAGQLTPVQRAWWSKLLMKGMGEYFFTNQIDFTRPNFVHLTSQEGGEIGSQEGGKANATFSVPVIPDKLDSILIPLGGGKDSVVTLELLTQAVNQRGGPHRLACLLINPTIAARDIAQSSGVSEIIEVERQMDPLLLQLNQQGYLNGHTPFSALAAFVSLLVAELWQLEGIAVSNERSSNEGNVIFHNQEINHQYSKTFEFERDLQNYSQNWLKQAGHYFSFVRPLYELQIAGLFAKLTTDDQPTHQLRTLFRSCNRGQKTNSWCGQCSKCLFAYSILSPFINQPELESLFGKNMLDDLSLWPIALELVGQGQNKPLDCVGTYEESTVAFYLAVQKIRSNHQDVPSLLAKINQTLLATETDLAQRATTILESWDQNHSLPQPLAEQLQAQVSQLKI